MVWGTSAELGDPEPTFGNPMGLVLERRTVPDLKNQKQENKSKHKMRSYITKKQPCGKVCKEFL